MIPYTFDSIFSFMIFAFKSSQVDYNTFGSIIRYNFRMPQYTWQTDRVTNWRSDLTDWLTERRTNGQSRSHNGKHYENRLTSQVRMSDWRKIIINGICLKKKNRNYSIEQIRKWKWEINEKQVKWWWSGRSFCYYFSL